MDEFLRSTSEEHIETTNLKNNILKSGVFTNLIEESLSEIDQLMHKILNYREEIKEWAQTLVEKQDYENKDIENMRIMNNCLNTPLNFGKI